MRNAERVGSEFECHDLSFIRSFSKGSWFSNMYMLPVTARFLTDVTLKVSFGEIHGIIGASGSGKSTLLQVISYRVEGKVTGEIKLNGETLTERNFAKLCKLVNFSIELLPYLTVEQTIRYHAQICLTCTVDVLQQRISMLMQKFDLLSYVHKKVDQLSQSARYRVIMVLNLLDDPLLVLLDDPLTKLDALSNYQLMSSLREYIKENSRMAIVTMRYPRSDIYQLIDGLTLLFYGEIVYSGPTKFMPHYFSQIGYKCPITENPAVYYLSLATVDRENPESYAETQEKATELVDTFRKRRDNFDFSSYQPKTLNDSPILSNYYGQPSVFKHVYLLSLRNTNLMLRSWPFLMTQAVYFVVFLFVAVFGGHFYTTTKHAPFSAAGTLFSLIYFTALISIFSTVINLKCSRSFMFWEVSNSLYNAALIPMAFLISTVPMDLCVLIVSSTTFMWIVNPAFYIQHLISLTLGLSCIIFTYKLTVLVFYCFTKDDHIVLITTTMLAGMSSIISSGFLKSYLSFNSINEGLQYLSSLCPERFANVLLDYEFVNSTKSVSCHRNEQTPFLNETDFCRWRNGNDYLSEMLSDPLGPPEQWQGFLIVLIIFLSSLATYFVVGPKKAITFSVPFENVLSAYKTGEYRFTNGMLMIEGGGIVNRGDVPYAAAIIRSTEHMSARCGAVFISKRHLVTAAHCFFDYFKDRIPCDQTPTLIKDIGKLKVAYGGICLKEASNCEKEDVTLATPKNIAFFPQFHNDKCQNGHDLAIMELDKDVYFDANVQPVCLFTGEDTEEFEKRIKVMKHTFSCGWGMDGRQFSRRLKYIYSRFKGFYENKADIIAVAPTYPKHDRICKGDSGSGMFGYDGSIGRDVIIGVHSYAENCALHARVESSEYAVTSIAHHVKDICNITGVCPPGVIPSA